MDLLEKYEASINVVIADVKEKIATAVYMPGTRLSSVRTAANKRYYLLASWCRILCGRIDRATLINRNRVQS